jgi:hypothetical protein
MTAKKGEKNPVTLTPNTLYPLQPIHIALKGFRDCIILDQEKQTVTINMNKVAKAGYVIKQI